MADHQNDDNDISIIQEEAPPEMDGAADSPGQFPEFHVYSTDSVQSSVHPGAHHALNAAYSDLKKRFNDLELKHRTTVRKLQHFQMGTQCPMSDSCDMMLHRRSSSEPVVNGDANSSYQKVIPIKAKSMEPANIAMATLHDRNQSLQTDNELLIREKDALFQENEYLHVEKNNLLQDNDDLRMENQQMSEKLRKAQENIDSFQCSLNQGQDRLARLEEENEELRKFKVSTEKNIQEREQKLRDTEKRLKESERQEKENQTMYQDLLVELQLVKDRLDRDQGPLDDEGQVGAAELGRLQIEVIEYKRELGRMKSIISQQKNSIQKLIQYAKKNKKKPISDQSASGDKLVAKGGDADTEHRASLPHGARPKTKQKTEKQQAEVRPEVRLEKRQAEVRPFQCTEDSLMPHPDATLFSPALDTDLKRTLPRVHNVAPMVVKPSAHCHPMSDVTGGSGQGRNVCDYAGGSDSYRNRTNVPYDVTQGNLERTDSLEHLNDDNSPTTDDLTLDRTPESPQISNGVVSVRPRVHVVRPGSSFTEPRRPVHPGNSSENIENRYRSRGFHTHPRPLNIERNTDLEATAAARSYDNTVRNVNLNVSQRKHKDSPSRDRLPVLNNDPLVGHKVIPSRNIYRENADDGGYTDVKVPPDNAEVVSATRNCPACDQEFPFSMTMDEFQQHVLECTGPGDTLGTARADHSEDRVCPMCSANFPMTIPQPEFEQHVNDHFEDGVLNMNDFVILSS